MQNTFSLDYLSIQTIPTAEIRGIYSIETIVPLKYLPIIFGYLWQFALLVSFVEINLNTTKRERG